MAESKQLEKIAEIMELELSKFGLSPGDEIWTIRNMCYECPNQDDHCQIDCQKKNKKYLEKTKILKTSISIGDGILPTHTFIDTDMNEFSMKDINVSVFTDREEAIDKL